MPIPLAMMIPFMATQSLVMGEAFGKAFQFGKRKISAMSNEEFNKLEIEQVASEMFESYKNIDMSLRESIEKSQDLQEFIVQQMLLIVPKMIESLLNKGAEVIAPVVQPAPPPPPSGGVVTNPADVTTADIFKTTKSRIIWISFKPNENGFGDGTQSPTVSHIQQRAKHDFYLSFDPTTVRTLVVISAKVLRQTNTGTQNRTWNYEMKMVYTI